MSRMSLPPGFRFHPTDVELVLYYLKRKVMGKKLHYEAISEVNIYKFSPWDLPGKSCLKSKDLEWFFFCPREKKYASGVRVKRATENGYWKTTGKDRAIRYNDKTVGFVKTLVFHFGHAPQGERTDWVIHEYRITDADLAAAGVQDTYVLCKVFKKNGAGPQNGAHYGAPFNEADWADDNADGAENHDISLTPDGPLLAGLLQTEEQDPLHERGVFAPGNSSGLPLVEKDPSPSAGGQTSKVAEDLNDDEVLHMLASFTEEDTVLFTENGINQNVDPSGEGMKELAPGFDGHDIFNGLGNLGTWGLMNEGRRDFSGLQNNEYFLNNMPSQDNSTFIELDDLVPPLYCPNGVASADQPSLGTLLGAPAHENMQQLYSGASFADMSQQASYNELPPLPEGSYGTENRLNVLQMVDQQIYQGSNSPNGLGFAFVQQENTYYPPNMERGSSSLLLVECYTRSRCNPAQTAAALSYKHSSIHIKAEVTHGAGECTNEALSLMMEGFAAVGTLLFFLYILLSTFLIWFIDKSDLLNYSGVKIKGIFFYEIDLQILDL